MRAFLSVILSACLIFGSVPLAYADDGLIGSEIVQDYIEQVEELSSSSDDGMTDSEDEGEDAESDESPGITTYAVPVALIIGSIIGGIFTASDLVSAIDNIVTTIGSWLGISSTDVSLDYAFVAYLDVITQSLWDSSLTYSIYDQLELITSALWAPDGNRIAAIYDATYNTFTQTRLARYELEDISSYLWSYLPTFSTSLGNIQYYIERMNEGVQEWLNDIYDETYEIKYSLSDIKTNQTILYAAVSSISNNLGSYWSTTNSYLADLYSLNSTISGNLLTISLLLQSDDFLSGISGSAWTDDDIVSLFDYLYYIQFYGLSATNNLRNIFYYVEELEILVNEILLAIQDLEITPTIIIDAIDSTGEAATNVWDFLVSLSETLASVVEDVSDAVVSLAELILSAIFELLDAVVGSFDDVEISIQIESLSASLSSSFPFGAIFVVTNALSVLSVDAKAPYFEFNLLGSSFVVDLSQYDSIAFGLRYLLLVLYLMGLFSKTSDWVFGSGGS